MRNSAHARASAQKGFTNFDLQQGGWASIEERVSEECVVEGLPMNGRSMNIGVGRSHFGRYTTNKW